MIYKSSLLQTDIWGSFRETQGWRAHRAEDVLILERPLVLGKTMLYAPEVVGSPEILLKLLPAVREIAKRRNSIFFRLELLIDKKEPLAEEWQAAFVYTGFEKSFESVQPEERQIIELGSDEQAVLNQMKQKGRYNIHVAEKHNVMVRESTLSTLEADVKIFYQLFKATAKRDHIVIRSESYFQALGETLYRHEKGRVFIASYEDQPLAAAIISLHDGVAVYLYGASGNNLREYKAPHALQWAAIEWAISKDAEFYDLLAIKPETDKPHKYDGITRFKQTFGGEDHHFIGSWDMVFAPTWYNLFKFAEKLRR